MSKKQKIAVIFGGSGFLGRYIAKDLAEAGYAVKIISRHPEKATQIKTAAQAGQIHLSRGNINNEKDIEKGVKNADLVINLTGILYQTRKQRFAAVHARGAERIAKAARAAEVERFIHVSALGVEHAANSSYARSKLNGEKAVIAAFPSATILRPSIIFGSEDNFFNMFAKIATFSPILPLIGGGKTRFQPVYAGDIAELLVKIIDDEKTFGKIIEIGGPKIYSFKELMQFILSTIGRKKLLVTLPFSLAKLNAAFMEILPRPILTRDQVNLLKSDNVVTDKSDIFKSLGITPKTINEIVPQYLARFKKN